MSCYALTTCNYKQSAAMGERIGLCVWNQNTNAQTRSYTHPIEISSLVLKKLRLYSYSYKRNVGTMRCRFYRMLLATNRAKYCPQQAMLLDCDIARGGRWTYRFLRHLVATGDTIGSDRGLSRLLDCLMMLHNSLGTSNKNDLVKSIHVHFLKWHCKYCGC